MAKKSEPQKEKILSAVSLWKKFDTGLDLAIVQVDEISENDAKVRYTAVEYDGHAVEDGRVRIHALFARPSGDAPVPAVLLLDDAGKKADRELAAYFVEKGYAVLIPDYSGKKTEEDDFATVYPPSLSYANYYVAGGLYSLDGGSAEKTCWFEWTYAALYSIEYLRSRKDITNIGVVGVRLGGEVAWKVMLSPYTSCGVTVNSAGWLSYRDSNRFGARAATNLTDDKHRYIAGVESQSYAPFVKCPVLMLCACNDYGFDYDRAYDTYSRIGGEEERENKAIVYCPDSGSCIGPQGLHDLDLFFEKYLKGRAIYIPSALSVEVTSEGEDLIVTATGDEEGLIEEMGVFYAETGANTKSVFREWLCVHKDRAVKNFKTSCKITPFTGAEYAYIYAYAQYINGFKTVSKIVAKALSAKATEAKSRVIFSGEAVDTFSVADHEEYSIGGIFLEKEAVPVIKKGYGGIPGAYSVGGIKTYKISAPKYVADEGAQLKFDVYSLVEDKVCVSVDVTGEEGSAERYTCIFNVKGGGKWKRIILSPNDFKNETLGKPLKSFAGGSALVFDSLDEENEVLVANVLWL